MNTGHQVIGRPSLGSWLSYGLGSENRDLPAFVVLLSGENTRTAASRAGAAASCRPRIKASSSDRAASRCCSSSNPEGVDADVRRRSIAAINDLNRLHALDVRGSRNPDAHRGV